MSVTINVITDDLAQNLHSVTLDDGVNIKAYGITKNGSLWAHWAETKTAEVAYESLPKIMSRSGFNASSKSLEVIEELIPQDVYVQLVKDLPGDVLVGDGPRHETMGRRYVARHVATKTLVAAPSTVRRPLHTFSPEQRRAVVQYKVNRFYTQQKYSTLNLEVKKVRAIFDRNIGPGGGWRCPDGTMYGGRITDRFGRGCGGGLTRRIGQAIMRAGRRLDDIGQARDTRRAARRAQRQVNRARRADRRASRRGRASNALERLSQRLVGDYVPADRRIGREARGGMDVETGRARRRPTPAPDVVPDGPPARPQGGRRRRRNVPEGDRRPRRENRTGRRRRVFDEATGDVVDPDTGEVPERRERDRDGGRGGMPRTIEEVDARIAELERERAENRRRRDPNRRDGNIREREIDDEIRQLELQRAFLQQEGRDGDRDRVERDPDLIDGSGSGLLPRGPDGRRPDRDGRRPRPDGDGRRPRPDGDGRRPAPRPRPDGDARPAPRPRREQTGERPDQRLSLRERVADAIERAVQRLIGNYVPADRRTGREARGGLPVDRERRNRRAQLSNALERAAQRLLRRRDGRSRERRREDNRRRRRRDERTITDEEMTNRLERELREELNLTPERDPDAAPEDARRDDEIREDVEEFVEAISAERDAPDAPDADEADDPSEAAIQESIDRAAEVDGNYFDMTDEELQEILRDVDARDQAGYPDELDAGREMGAERELDRRGVQPRATERERPDPADVDRRLIAEAEERRRNGEPPTREQQAAIERQRDRDIVEAEREARRRVSEEAAGPDRDDDDDRSPEEILDDDQYLIDEAEARRREGQPPTREQQAAIERQREREMQRIAGDAEERRRERLGAEDEEERRVAEEVEREGDEIDDLVGWDSEEVAEEVAEVERVVSLRARKDRWVDDSEIEAADTESLERLVDEIDKTDMEGLSVLQRVGLLRNRKLAQRQLDIREGRDGVDVDPVSRRDLTNVRNRFPRRGLPRRAFWRDDDSMSRSDKDAYERRFGQYYYDDEGNLNRRGLRVNRELGRERHERLQAERDKEMQAAGERGEAASPPDRTPLEQRSDRTVVDPDGVERPAVPSEIDPMAELGATGNNSDDFARRYLDRQNRRSEEQNLVWRNLDAGFRDNIDNPEDLRDFANEVEEEMAELRGRIGARDSDVVEQADVRNGIIAREAALARINNRLSDFETESVISGRDTDDDFPAARARNALDDLVMEAVGADREAALDERLEKLMDSEQGREIVREAMRERLDKLQQHFERPDENPDTLVETDEFLDTMARAAKRRGEGDLDQLFYNTLTEMFGNTAAGENLYPGDDGDGRITPTGRLRVLNQYARARKDIRDRLDRGNQLPGHIFALADIENQRFGDRDPDPIAEVVQRQLVSALLKNTIPRLVADDRGIGEGTVRRMIDLERNGGLERNLNQMLDNLQQVERFDVDQNFANVIVAMLQEARDARRRGDSDVANELTEELDRFGAALGARLREQNGTEFPPDLRADDFAGMGGVLDRADNYRGFGVDMPGSPREMGDDALQEQFEFLERLHNPELLRQYVGERGFESPLEQALVFQRINQLHGRGRVQENRRIELAEEMNRRGLKAFDADRAANRVQRQRMEAAQGINDPLDGSPARRMEKMVDEAFDRRRDQLQRIDGFDPANPPWENLSDDDLLIDPDNLRAILDGSDPTLGGIERNRDKIDAAFAKMFVIEYTAPDGTKMRTTRATDDLDNGVRRWRDTSFDPNNGGDWFHTQYNGQVVVGLNIEAQNSQGEWVPVGYSIRSFFGDAVGDDDYAPRGIESKYLVIDRVDIESKKRLSNAGGYYIDDRGSFRNVTADLHYAETRDIGGPEALEELERRGLLTKANQGKTFELEDGTRVVLTGTPRANSTDNDWALYQAADPDAKVPRDNGFGTAFNYHWFNYANALGYNKITVSAGLEDGGYVWGRFGYRPATSGEIRSMRDAGVREIMNFDAGRNSIIKNAEQRELLQTVLDQMEAANFNVKTSPAHLEMILALENGDSSKGRRQEVRDFMRPFNILNGQIDFSDPRRGFIHTKPTNKRDRMDTRFGNPAQRDPVMGRITEDATSTSGLAQPRQITNPKIQTTDAAVAHVRNGGSLDEVPNEFWHDAIRQNASDRENDPSTMFFIQVQDWDQTGNMSSTFIYRRRKADGTPGDQGYVMKESLGNAALDGGWDEPAADVIGYNVAHALGLMPEGAGWDGAGDTTGQPLAVIPFAGGLFADGVTDVNGYGGTFGIDPIDGTSRLQNYSPELLDRQPKRALPQRFGHFLHNYLLGGFDKHNLNGMAMVGDDGNTVIAPIDHGRMALDGLMDGMDPARQQLLRQQFNMMVPGASELYEALLPDADMRRYGDNAFWLDMNMMDKIQDYYQSIPAVDQREFREEMIAIYDDLMERAERIAAEGDQAFIAQIQQLRDAGGLPPAGFASWDEYVERVKQYHNHLSQKVAQADANRQILLDALGGS